MPLDQLGIKFFKRLALLATVFLFCEACYHPRNSFECPDSNSNDSLSVNFISIHKLHVKLEEVSGISMDSKGLIWCVNDEEGVLYQLDTSHRNISIELDFGPPGDYEGVAIRNDSAFVIRSDATLFEFALDNPKALLVKKIQQLPATCETESIASYSNSLYTICKQQGTQEKHVIFRLDNAGSSYKATESFDLTACLQEFMTQQGSTRNYRPTDLYYDDKNKLWLISATKPASLVFFNDKGEWVFGKMLDPKDWPQPEGICQLNDSSYVLTSESKGHGVFGQFKIK